MPYLLAFLKSDLKSNPKIAVELLLLRYLLVDCLMSLSISLIVLKISKSSLSGSIVINLQPSSCFVAFCPFV